MLDVKLLRQQLDFVATRLRVRGYHLDTKQFEKLEEERKSLQVQVEHLQSERNRLSKAIGQAKAGASQSVRIQTTHVRTPDGHQVTTRVEQQHTAVNGSSIDVLMAQVGEVTQQLEQVSKAFERVQDDIVRAYASLPNLPHESVPVGKSEDDNVEIRRWSQPRTYTFPVRDHVDLGALHNRMDFAAGAKITGSRFVVLRGSLARLHRALIQFMLDVHIQDHGYEEYNVPYLVNHDSLFGTGQLPNLAEDLFFNRDDPFGLIPTAEVPLTNLFRDEVVPEQQLPIRMVAHTPCFRREAGSYGKDVRGMIRLHQFEKVELVQITHPEKSYQAHEELTQHAEIILQRLQLPYRVVALCTGDLGFSSAKTYDLEVWLPSQQRYREISSCSNFEGFQARRMQARYRDAQSNKNEYIHTINGSGVAAGRAMVAILENFQDAEGRIHLPEVLWPYMKQEIINLNEG
jgi:seryl-tRNA synthetase